MIRILATTFLILAPAALAEEAKTFRYNGNWYAFGNFGACQHGYGLFGAGAGAEGLLWKGISVGADGSYQSFTDGWGFGMLSVQAGYHFVNRDRRARWDPFVTYGVGLGIASGGYGGTGNLGGGFNYWFKDKMALRMEFRVHGIAEEALVTGRIGISFR